MKSEDPMTFHKDLLPGPITYFENQGLTLKGPRSAKWKNTACNFHGGSDSMRINTINGAWRCMNCGVSGGDVLAYEIKVSGKEFVEAAKALGSWVDDGRIKPTYKPTTLSPRLALSVMAFESTLVAIAASNIANGVKLSEIDLARLIVAAGRINRLVEEFS
jgi:hypothetical protein